MAYIGNAPAIQSTEFREEFFPTSNQTTFITGGFHPSAVSVTRNGVLLSEADYTKGTDNVTITLNSAAISGDVVVIRGNRSLAQGVSVSESRVEYTWQSGDTVVQLNADVIPAYTDVYLNGVKLAAADYSINASTKQVSFTSAPAVGDVIAVVHRNETSALVGLPLKDSSGAEILSESGSTVTLANVDTATIGSNALVVDSSGNVGIGTSSPSQKLSVAGNAMLETNQGFLYLSDVGTGNSGIYVRGTGASNELRSHSTGTFTWEISGSEKMRIDSSGNVLVGTSSSTGPLANGIAIHHTASSGSGLEIQGSNTGGTYTSVVFRDGSGTDCGSIDINATTNTTAYTTSSDYRLKNNIEPMTDSISRLKQLKPCFWNWISAPDNRGEGFIAHEVQIIVPEAVTGEKDEVDDDGNPEYQGIDQSKLVPLLTAALQESIALIESQQSQIDTLTAKTQEQDLTIASLISRIETLEATP